MSPPPPADGVAAAAAAAAGDGARLSVEFTPPGEGDYEWCYPPEAAAEAMKMGVATDHPYWTGGGRVICPQAAMRREGTYGYSPKYLPHHAAAQLDDQIAREFVGATLCGSLTITKLLLKGGYGRGWKADYVPPGKEDEAPQAVFVKTLGITCTDFLESDYARDCEIKAQHEAKVYAHKWFPAAVDQPGAACQRLCYGLCENPTTGFKDKIFFICGEYCAGEDLWAYMPHKESFHEEFAKRIFGQLARGLCTMKHSGQLEQFLRGEVPTAEEADGPVIKGCLHRDVKLENIIVTGDFNTKLMDYGSLKFTDLASQEVGGRTVKYKTKTPWLGTDIFKPPSFFYTSFDVQSEGYDPAAWDVWSLGTVLLYIVGGATFYAKLRGDVYRFFEITMQVRPRLPEHARRWAQKRRKVGNKCLFYHTDASGKPNKLDNRGVPVVPCHRAPAVGGHDPPDGIPSNADLWAFLSDLDPDARNPSPGAFSPELKDLLNRMLDVDQERRISIEDVCQHPWLASHQSHGDDAVLETEEQRELYRSEMHRRFHKYINTHEGLERISSHLSVAEAVDKLQTYADLEGGIFVRHDDAFGSNVIMLHRSVDGGKSPKVKDKDGIPRLPIYAVTVRADEMELKWQANTADGMDGHVVNESATLAEWSHFKETLRFMLENPDVDVLADDPAAAAPAP